MEEINNLKKEYEKILQELKKAQEERDWIKFGKLAKRREEIEKKLKIIKEIEKIKKEIQEADLILKKEENKELKELAKKEKERLEKILENFQRELRPKEKKEEKEAVILEIRPGVGGKEASLFAQDLFSMYLKYAQKKGWRTKIFEREKTDLGGIKGAIFEIEGEGAFEKLKYEGGIHRVQRIPETEKSGRIHTSTASVVVLKKPRKAKIKIKPEDLKIETFRASGPGGQYVNRRETAVRITHIPSGIVVSCQSQRTQAQNKENALSILEAKLLKIEEEKQQKKAQRERRSQIGRMERSEKIRTYNFLQDRITDHRIKKTWHNIEEILSGNLDPIIEELSKNLK